MAFVKVVGVIRSTTLVIKVLCTSIQIFGVIQFQTSAQQNNLCQARSTPRRRVATLCPRPRLGVRACTAPEASTPPESHLPQTHAPRGASFSPHATHRLPLAQCARA
jgi:hypothetical protein